MLTALIISTLWLAVVVLIVVWFRGASRGEQALGPAPPPGSTFTLGGRRFRRTATTTLEQGDYVVDVVRQAGIADPALLPGEEPDAYVERVFCALHARHKLYAMAASILVPAEAEEWSWGAAAEVAAFLPTLDEPEDQRRYYALLQQVLLPFCTSGAGSWLRSATSGSPSPAPSPAAGGTSPACAPATGRS